MMKLTYMEIVVTRMKVVEALHELHHADVCHLSYMRKILAIHCTKVAVSIREVHHAVRRAQIASQQADRMMTVMVMVMVMVMTTYRAKVAVSIREFHHAQQHSHGKRMVDARRVIWFMFLSLDYLIHLIHLLIFPIRQVPSLMLPFMSGTSDWMMLSANLPRLFMTLMRPKIAVKESSNEMRMRENKSSSKMRIAEKPRQDSAVMQYLLNWKRGRTVYLLYRYLLRMVLVTMPLSSNRCIRLLMRQLLVMQLTFWKRFDWSVSNLNVRDRIWLRRGSGNVLNSMPSARAWMMNVHKEFTN